MEQWRPCVYIDHEASQKVPKVYILMMMGIDGMDVGDIQQMHFCYVMCERIPH
jgi:hypothetical protein